jgi:hypothetical protein
LSFLASQNHGELRVGQAVQCQLHPQHRPRQQLVLQTPPAAVAGTKCNETVHSDSGVAIASMPGWLMAAAAEQLVRALPFDGRRNQWLKQAPPILRAPRHPPTLLAGLNKREPLRAPVPTVIDPC